MLATNLTFYRRVLRLDIAKLAGSTAVDWSAFFGRSSAYKLLYTLQIVQAVLEDGEDDTGSVVLLNAEAFPAYKVQQATATTGPAAEEQSDTEHEKTGAGPGGALLLKKKSSQVMESPQEDAQLRAQWTEEFLSQGGFQHILKDFMAWTVPAAEGQEAASATEPVELKYVAFMLRLLRTFIMAAFSTSDSDAYQAAALARKSSSLREGDPVDSVDKLPPEEGSSFKQLQNLL